MSFQVPAGTHLADISSMLEWPSINWSCTSIVTRSNLPPGNDNFESTRFLRTKSSSDANAADSGNWGIKDVTAALRWVKNNIAAFGGDPTRVTLVGHDTGAAIANLLFLSPTSKASKLANAERNIKRMKWNILGTSETRWTGEGSCVSIDTVLPKKYTNHQ
ncbi:hypothetical protein HUJ04_012934 [Dendroctonus ponderosae]|nr:hypothetical protein HUJ04_012934 [Dendroctonus ponderosae]